MAASYPGRRMAMRSVSSAPRPQPGVRDRGPGRVGPAGAVDAAAGVCRGRREVEPADPRLRPAAAGVRAEHQLLVQLRGAAVEGAADEVRVALLQLARAEDPAGEDARAEAGCELLEPLLHAVGHPLAVVVVPRTAD